MSSREIHRDLPDEDIIAHCWSSNAEYLAGTENLGRKVVKIGDDTVVKFGRSVTKFEFENLKIARALVDPNIVHIPEVYRFFSDNDGKLGFLRNRGYILMEYVRGTRIDPLEDPEKVQKIAGIVAHFASIRGDIPGTLSRGPCGSILFPDCDEFTFDTVQAMEDFFNGRLFPHNPPKINLKGVDLVLCHLDIAPRNILWKEDGSVCLLDWASAGFYPRCFEFAAQNYLLGFEKEFNQMLIDAIEPPLSKAEEAISLGVMVARGNSERYTFRKPSCPPRRRRKPGQLRGTQPPDPVLPTPDPGSLPPYPGSLPPDLLPPVFVELKLGPGTPFPVNNIDFSFD